VSDHEVIEEAVLSSVAFWEAIKDTVSATGDEIYTKVIELLGNCFVFLTEDDWLEFYLIAIFDEF
jgi:hypothetical protein